MLNTPDARLQRALASLEGLSVGDAFGEGFFMSFELAVRLMESGQFEGPPYDFEDEGAIAQLIGKRDISFIETPWRWTDDTAMALEIVANLREFGEINPDALARGFARRYEATSLRAYGAGMHDLLPKLETADWRDEAGALFGGTGSFGNGSAMRAAPIGAYFADDPEAAARNAALSSIVTHSHPEGVAGAVAVAMAACFAAQQAENPRTKRQFISDILPFLEDSEVKDSVRHARGALEEPFAVVVPFLGNGSSISAPDTVPFCLWCAAHQLDDFEQAMWLTVAGLGDRDTTCAIVGGIVAARVGTDGIPAEWREKREDFTL